MARATTKSALLSDATIGFDKLTGYLDTWTPEQLHAQFCIEDRDTCVADVLAHLHEWHNMVLRWHEVGTIHGGSPAVPGEGYTWRTIPALNQEIWETYRGVELSDIEERLRASHQAVLAEIESHSDAELFERGVYQWTKSSTLGAYFVSATGSHYFWAMKKLRKQFSALRNSADS